MHDLIYFDLFFFLTESKYLFLNMILSPPSTNANNPALQKFLQGGVVDVDG
jgi:hypothetical protein